jgi:hypothetical protein
VCQVTDEAADQNRDGGLTRNETEGK